MGEKCAKKWWNLNRLHELRIDEPRQHDLLLLRAQRRQLGALRLAVQNL